MENKAGGRESEQEVIGFTRQKMTVTCVRGAVERRDRVSHVENPELFFKKIDSDT